MMYIFIIIGVIMLLSASFFIGFFCGLNEAFTVQYPNDEFEDAYCFGCEIEMPVKEVDGVLYCSNCGLRH